MAYQPSIPPTISTANSSTAALGASGVFTGTAEDVTNYATISVSVVANVASATDGLSIQQSSDGTNWDITDVFTVPAASGKTYTVGRTAKYFRVVFTNGGTLQASFRLQSIFTPGVVKGSTVRPQDGRANDNDFEEVLAYPMVYDSVTNTWSRNRAGNVRNRLGQYAVSSFRTLGTAATPQNIFTLENPTGSGKKMAVKKLEYIMDTTAALATVSPSIKLSRPAALPTGGTVLTGVKWNTTDAAAVGVARGGTASDGGAATVITATAGAAMATQLVDRQQTAAGFIQHIEYTLLFELAKDDPLILQPGEALLLQAVLANAATTHFVVNAIWEEYI